MDSVSVFNLLEMYDSSLLKLSPRARYVLLLRRNTLEYSAKVMVDMLKERAGISRVSVQAQP